MMNRYKKKYCMKNTVRLSPYQSWKIIVLVLEVWSVCKFFLYFTRYFSGQVPPSPRMMTHQSLTWISICAMSLCSVLNLGCCFCFGLLHWSLFLRFRTFLLILLKICSRRFFPGQASILVFSVPCLSNPVPHVSLYVDLAKNGVLFTDLSFSLNICTCTHLFSMISVITTPLFSGLYVLLIRRLGPPVLIFLHPGRRIWPLSYTGKRVPLNFGNATCINI